jgi:AhpD family alkylhydroperoxidase
MIGCGLLAQFASAGPLARPALLRLRGGEAQTKTGKLCPALLRLRGGEEQTKTGKLWTASTFTRDHVRFMAESLHYLGAYVGPRALPPKTLEAVMVTVNTINTCPYCTGLHGQLARMAGTVVDKKAPEVVYATTFAEEVGRGSKVQVAFDKLAATIGFGKALSVRALCWALLWGKTTGNTINDVRDKLVSLRWTKISPFGLVVLALYGPFFIVVGIANAALSLMPAVPAWFSTGLGVVLWAPQALHFLIFGLLSLAVRLLVAPVVGLSL